MTGMKNRAMTLTRRAAPAAASRIADATAAD